MNPMGWPTRTKKSCKNFGNRNRKILRFFFQSLMDDSFKEKQKIKIKNFHVNCGFQLDPKQFS